jgi:hypothetical protein
MTMNILTDEKDIASAQKQLESVLESVTNKKVNARLSFKGGDEEAIVSYSKKYNICFSLVEVKNSHYNNAFRLNEPKENSYVYMTVKIDIPIKGINRRFGGAFARDEKNRIFLIHSGRIGGGKEGIGKKLFFEKYDGELVNVQYGDRISEFAIIGDMESPDFAEKLTKFILKVDNIKKI